MRALTLSVDPPDTIDAQDDPGTDAGNRKQSAFRVLMITPRFLPEMGGIEIHVREVAKRLAAAGHGVTVLTTDRTGALAAEETFDGVRVRRVQAWPRRKDYYFAPQLWHEVATIDCDIIHIQGYHTLVAPLGMLAACRKRVPFVITFHSGGHSSRLRTRLRETQWYILGSLVRRAHRWIGVSQFEAEFFSRKMRLPRDRVSVIPNGASLPKPASAPASRNGPSIVSIGRLERYKGHHRAIEAFPHLLERFPDARLRVLGEGPYKAELLALAARLGRNDRIEIGGVPPSERQRLVQLLGDASLVVLLSDYEAHPVAVMEALALGRKVLVTDCSGFIEMAREGMVRAIPLGSSPTQIAAAMTEALEDRRPRPKLVLPTWEECASHLCQVYAAVLEETGR